MGELLTETLRGLSPMVVMLAVAAFAVAPRSITVPAGKVN